jgi:hypothetical protein
VTPTLQDNPQEPLPRSWRERAILFARRREVWAMAFMAALLGAFIVLLFAVRGDETIDRDRIITRELQRFRSGPLDTLQRFLTIVGNFGTLLPLAIVGVIGYLRAGRKWAALLLALTLLGQPLNIAIKRIAERPRPSETLDGIVFPPATRWARCCSMASWPTSPMS